MRKVLLGIAAAATVLIGSIEMADAQQRRNGQGYGVRGGYAQGYRPQQQYRGNYYRNNGNRYVQNNYYGRRGNGNAWAAGAAGLAVGALLGAALTPNYGYAQPYWGGGMAPVPGPVCTQVVVGRFWNGFNWVPQVQNVCQ